MFHSNYTQASSVNYLRFPLTTGDLEDKRFMTYRKLLAYCKALGIRGRASRLKSMLQEALAGAEGSIDRPDDPKKSVPPAESWEAWSCEVN